MTTRSDAPALLLRVHEAADRLAISRSLLYKLLAAGRLHSVHIGSAMRIPVAELERFAAELPLEPVEVGVDVLVSERVNARILPRGVSVTEQTGGGRGR